MDISLDLQALQTVGLKGNVGSPRWSLASNDGVQGWLHGHFEVTAACGAWWRGGLGPHRALQTQEMGTPSPCTMLPKVK